MPDLSFQVSGVEPAANGLTPLLHFKLQVACSSTSDCVEAVLLNVQIQFQPPQRTYSAVEKEKLVELFGSPDRWGQTLRNRLWAHAHATMGAFAGSAETILPVPCSYDLNLASTKYFDALEAGEVSLLFLFSGSVFHTAEGRLQVEPISWSKECVYRMPVLVWRQLMEAHYPNRAWLELPRDTFSKLQAYKRANANVTWDHTINSLLELAAKPLALLEPSNAGVQVQQSEVAA